MTHDKSVSLDDTQVVCTCYHPLHTRVIGFGRHQAPSHRGLCGHRAQCFAADIGNEESLVDIFAADILQST